MHIWIYLLLMYQIVVVNHGCEGVACLGGNGQAILQGCGRKLAARLGQIQAMHGRKQRKAWYAIMNAIRFRSREKIAQPITNNLSNRGW
jgi:hypothetical protein